MNARKQNNSVATLRQKFKRDHKPSRHFFGDGIENVIRTDDLDTFKLFHPDTYHRYILVRAINSKGINILPFLLQNKKLYGVNVTGIELDISPLAHAISKEFVTLNVFVFKFSS